MRVFLLLLLLAAAGYGLCRDAAPTHDQLRETALRLEFERGICSGTAIGPDTLLSAKHCFADKLARINGQPASVVESHTESRDRIVVKVAGIRFKHWAKRGPLPNQGDRLRFWGNPQGEPGVYREAIVSRVYTDQIVLQTIVCGGDSGSGLLDDQGRVVGIVSAVTGDRVCRFGISF